MYTVWCEWDIGLESKVFATKEIAIKYANEALKLCDFEEDYDELSGEGLIGLESVEIYYD